ncbi:valyl tRNA-synthetase [Candidatus Caldarchaeum subterraneum]|uniref:Valine--tRNA ligase n=1 Tax=Caldiarchaeum subterraneum TaxID=311458 RepID=E6N964_CALS0|nr:valyl tRNA-synthetase [Candidatus Caldarchaeum subterraneum]BAJ48871.1 valyl tRNA-synthetase [Candidatus Caldarchaeum subterraneum]BAJ51492.1 valyl tRNA-synthetase [Candidatus Caldarchaeum subterraneum]
MASSPTIQEKSWNPQFEKEILRLWEKEDLYRFNIRSRRKKFVIDTPPPYPSGRPWHIGAAAHYSQIDMIARTARMMGYMTLFPIGIDRNGLPVEIYTEKKYGIAIRDTPREKFIELCKTSLDELEAEMLEIMKRLGLSGDFKNRYRTDSPEYRRFTQNTFIKLWKNGLVYRASRPNNYCPMCGTTIADAEVEYEDLPSTLHYVKFPLENGGYIPIATTRPELIPACAAVIYNPADSRYAHLENKTATTPLFGDKVPIIARPEAKPDFGTGAVMVCSYGDHTDVRLFRELKLPEKIVITLEGRMNENAGFLKGLRVEEARKAIVEKLIDAGYYIKSENIIHSTPVCERSKTPIEIIPMDEYYLNQLDFLDDLRKIAHEMEFLPEHSRQLLLNWIDSVSIDWPISRRRYYATEVPVWYCNSCGTPVLPDDGQYHQPWREKAPVERCPKCGSTSFRGDERTFDTWMDSSISPLFVISDRKTGKIHESLYPVSIRPQGKEIVRTWLYYTVLRCYLLTGKRPFNKVWISGLGLDEHGEKMSKSKGNVIDPMPILEKYGADCFRFWNAQEASLGEDFRISEARIASVGKFLSKLWNLAKYVSMFPKPSRATLTPTDRWILAELSKTVETCLAGYEGFNFFIPSNEIRRFIWNIFASHYVEMSKPRAYGQGFTESEQKSAFYTLHTVLRTTLLLLAPITPFITDYIWRRLYGGKSIHLERFPKPAWPKTLTKYTEPLTEFNSAVWAKKKSLNLSLRDEISYEIPAELKIFEKDLRAMHRIVG